MNKMDEIEKQLNRMFQFMFKEDKKYIFIENDKLGFVDINVADVKVFDFIVQDKQRFLPLIDGYLDIHKVRLRKYNGTLPDLSEKPNLLKEVLVKKYIKQKVFVVKKQKTDIVINTFEGINEVEKLITELKEKLFELRDDACDRNKKNPSENEDHFMAGTYLTVAEAYSYIQKIEHVLNTTNNNENFEITKRLEQFIIEEYEKIKDENLKLLNEHEERTLYENIQWANNWGQIHFIGKLNTFLNKLKEYVDK
jgi:hypothetical protein